MLSNVNSPGHRGVGSNDFDAGFGIASNVEEFPVGDVLERPGAFSFLGRNPL